MDWEPDSQAPRIRPLVINAGDNLELGQSNVTLPYQHVKMLGHGGCASVEMVRDVNTGSFYARKVFKHVTQRNLKVAKQELRNEVQIMQRLSSHHHVIQVHATYIMGRELGIILSPVADGGDLQSFMQDYRDNRYSNGSGRPREILLKAFGCLASGLAFMHQQTIRHKDIKPSNILIHKGHVLYTDFGISYDFSSSGQGTTTGLPAGHTKRYCAPEVADMRPRNSKSDIFSLGCVFLEIFEATHPTVIDIRFDGNFHEVFRTYPEEDFFPGWGIDYLLDLIRAMLQINPAHRPTARGITLMLYGYVPQKDTIFFCEDCINEVALEGMSTNRSSPLPPQSASEPLWKLVNDSIRECTKYLLLRETATPRQIAQWVVDNHLEFLLSQRLDVRDWLRFYEGQLYDDDDYSWRKRT